VVRFHPRFVDLAGHHGFVPAPAGRQGAPGRGGVSLAGRAARERQPVGAHHVAHVGEVAASGQGADLEHRRGEPAFDRRDLARDVAPHETGRLPRADVVEARTTTSGSRSARA
jgi:hypothetical protein